jgi:hypothetical protein
MKFIKIAVLVGIIYSINLLSANPGGHSKSQSHQDVSRSITFTGDLPKAYVVEIDFIDENHKHTQTVNDGSFQIYVEVYGLHSFLSTGELGQIDGHFECAISSDDGVLSGSIDIQRTITFIENTEDSEMEEAFRNKIIEIILNEIQSI